mgnify:CR=1 FL=1
MLNSIFGSSASSSIGLTEVLISMIIAIILGFIIALTHKKTSRYSKNFLITVSLLPILVEAVMLMVNGNLGTSVAIMGAFSLVRFRSIPGTSKEILIVFFAMAVGLSCGMGQIWFAIILTVIGCLLLLLLNKVNIFEKEKGEKKLKILIPENLEYDNVFEDIFNECTNKAILEKTKTTNMGSMFELSYKVNIKKEISEKEFIDKLRTRNGNLKIVLEREEDGCDL